MFPDFLNPSPQKNQKKARDKQVNQLMKLTSKLVSKVAKTPEQKKEAKKAMNMLGQRLKNLGNPEDSQTEEDNPSQPKLP